MDNIVDPNITFDKEGVCNYWYEYHKKAEEKLIHGDEGKLKWQNAIEEIKGYSKNKKYDCIIGVSGGVDSTYVAYLVKKAKLRPLVVHFDNGWNSEIAVGNINKIIEYLDADLYTLVINWEEFRDLQRAYIKAGVVDIEALTDHAIFGTLYRVAAEKNIKYVIGGLNVETEQVMPKTWNYSKIDHVNILDIHRQYGELELKTFPIFNTIRKKYYLNFKKLTFVSPLNWAPYNKAEVKEIISEEIGWVDYGGKHHESIFTKFYQNYILPTKFRIDKRKAHLSNLICSGQLTKKEALKEMELPLYDKHELVEDKEFVLKKLGFDEKEFDEIMRAKPKSHFDFKTELPIDEQFPILKPIKRIYKAIKR
ncbi:MAG: N-acetyl sugar amidotransferase [Flavobacteriales bacterium]|nr:N-acetyl sugar amidotransferase [Flavobacteriales bacterium]